jgi:alpha-L-fucosidase
MKKYFALAALLYLSTTKITAQEQAYTPSPQNERAREWFSDAKFGLFIHWGPFSIPGDGEWVMNDRNITVKNYTRLEKFFNPIDFDAHKWVSLAKAAGMKYITLITRHHDGFSMWDTRYSDFNIMHTPYKKDIVRLMADECHKQGIKLFLYYSLLDWRRDDYSWWTGRTGQGTGRTVHGDWDHYVQFMKNQLNELLTHYGSIAGIWFDGYWDQMDKESKDRKDNDVKIDWHIREIYDLIHHLQPKCLIGNNHHMTPLPGEDFQMFEQDIPGENTGGLSFQKISALPLETCATINSSWGFNITDTAYSSNPPATAATSCSTSAPCPTARSSPSSSSVCVGWVAGSKPTAPPSMIRKVATSIPKNGAASPDAKASSMSMFSNPTPAPSASSSSPTPKSSKPIC